MGLHLFLFYFMFFRGTNTYFLFFEKETYTYLKNANASVTKNNKTFACELWRYRTPWTYYYSPLITRHMASYGKNCDFFCDTNIFWIYFLSAIMLLILNAIKKKKRRERKKKK